MNEIPIIQPSTHHSSGSEALIDIWERLASTAVLGTDRQPVDLSADGPLGAVLAKLQGLDEEHKLLSATAAVMLYKRVRSSPAIDDGELPVPAPEKHLLPCPTHAREQLAVLLTGLHDELLPEWLELLAQSGACLPEEALPAMLKLGNLRPTVTAIIGEWIRWLARKEPGWSCIVDSDITNVNTWESATLKRVALLISQRQQNPIQAREFLASVWDKIDVATRNILLATLAIGLCQDDEPFLESLLDDEWREVRSTAADLLARLPHSRFIQRMRERLEPLLAYSPAQPAMHLTCTASCLARLDVTLPAACDRSMRRDGIQVKLPAHLQSRLRNIGQKGWWLLQMVSYTPPGEWCARWVQSPDELLRLVHGHEWQDVLRNGWVQATLRFHDLEWARVLLPLVLTRQTILGGWAEFIALLPPAEVEEMTIKALQGRKGGQDVLPSVLDLLRFYPYPWSRQLALAVRQKVHELLASPAMFQASYRSGNSEIMDIYLYHFTINAPQDTLPEMAAVLQLAGEQIRESPYQEFWSRLLQKATSRLEFRAAMHRVFKESTRESMA